MSEVHELKTWPAYFQEVWRGNKTFELRRDDRGFMPGDLLFLREYDPDAQSYTGRELTARVVYLLRNAKSLGLQPGHVVMSIQVQQRGGHSSRVRAVQC